jgi:hypothetical protein
MSTDGLSVAMCLNEISARLTHATAIVRAAVTCAENGSEREALRIALDIDERLHEAQTLHAAMILVGRIRRQASHDSDDA